MACPTDDAHVYREDRPRPNESDDPSADQFSVSTDCSQVMRIPLQSGYAGLYGPQPESHQRFLRILARTSGNPLALEQAVRSTFREVDPGSPVYHVKSLEAYFSGRIADRTFELALLVALGTLALVLAAASTALSRIQLRSGSGRSEFVLFAVAPNDSAISLAAALSLGSVCSGRDPDPCDPRRECWSDGDASK